MTLVIEHPLEIDAPAETVWRVLTDLDAYSDWNPFVVRCRSTLKVGDPIHMHVKIFGDHVQKQSEVIFEHVPGRRLCYGLAPQRMGALSSRRSHTVRERGPDRCVYESHFELSGWLAPVVELLMGKRLAHGFRSMTMAVGQRAQSFGGGAGDSRVPSSGFRAVATPTLEVPE